MALGLLSHSSMSRKAEPMPSPSLLQRLKERKLVQWGG